MQSIKLLISRLKCKVAGMPCWCNVGHGSCKIVEFCVGDDGLRLSRSPSCRWHGLVQHNMITFVYDVCQRSQSCLLNFSKELHLLHMSTIDDVNLISNMHCYEF
jgi:hypothetical protein